MKSLPLISILLPVRNDSSMLKNCLNDIKNQTINNYELIIVDDGSIDNTPFLLEKASRDDPRIKVIRSEHKGIVSALNIGLGECRGNFIARMDADDRMHKSRFEKQIKYLQQNQELDFIGCKIKGFTENGSLSESILKYQSWSNSLITHKQIECDLFAESPISHPTFFTTKELFNKLGGYSNNEWAEDYDIILRAFGLGAKFGKFPGILLYKYHSKDRLSKCDNMYKRPAMFEAKVNYLLEYGKLRNRRGVLIVGTGPTGRQVAKSFTRRGVRILGFVDNRPGTVKRNVKGFPAWGFPSLPNPQFLKNFHDSLIILAIGNYEGQKAFSEILENLGFIENFDYVRVIYNWPKLGK